MTTTPKPLVLMILDGFGHSESQESNAVFAANKPVLDRLCATVPNGLISGSGMDVGLPDGQMGNSEVGHMNLGAGRVVYQDFTRVTKAIRDGEFFENPTICAAVDKAVAAGKAVHFMGLLSDGGVHSHQDHLVAMAELAFKRGAEKIYLHAFLDGRDTPPKSAEPSLRALQDLCAKLGNAHVASVSGRYYAMDRDKRWDRVRLAWDAMVEASSDHHASSGIAALEAAYARGENDEFVLPTVIDGARPMADGDAVVFMNFRADRARQLSAAFVSPAFDGFEARVPTLARYVCLTEYDAKLPAPVAFGPDDLRETFGELLAEHGLTQLRIAETEKYAHVTFFMSGGREAQVVGEDRVLIPSPKVATYDLQPEMSLPQLTTRLTDDIRARRHDVILCNIANPDMVGHSGILAAAIQAAEAVDHALGAIRGALAEVGGEMIVTADHGNLEMMRDPDTGQPHTSHTVGPVPFVYCGRKASLRDGGALRDIAPTMLSLLGLAKPAEMSGRSLVELA